MLIPVFQRLAKANTVLLAGAGGGYDLFAGLPVLRWLLQAGKRVHLANLLDVVKPTRTYAELTLAIEAFSAKVSKLRPWREIPF